MLTLADLATDAVLEGAYAWLCTRRKDWSPHADVWRLRQDWSVEKAQLREELGAGTYEVGLLDRLTSSPRLKPGDSPKRLTSETENVLRRVDVPMMPSTTGRAAPFSYP